MAIGGFSDEIEHLNWRWNNRYNLSILHKYKNLPSLLFNKPCIVKYSWVDLYDKSFFKFIAQYLCLGYAAAGYFSNNSGDSLSELNLRYQCIYLIYIFSWSIFKNIDNFNPMVMSSGLVLLGNMPNYKFTQGREALELHRFPCFFFCHAKHVNQHCTYLDRTFAIYFFSHYRSFWYVRFRENARRNRPSNKLFARPGLYDSSNVFWFHFITHNLF